MENNLIKRWESDKPLLYFSGLQIINSNIFNTFNNKCFSINAVWDKLIAKMELNGEIMSSNLSHVGDMKSYKKINKDFSLE